MKQSHLIFVISGWIIVILLSWIWNINSIRKNTLDLVENKAQAFFNEVEITRLWNAQHGGVYVPVTEEIRPNQYLNVPNRDITTTTGIELTLVNPAFMTRQISELAMTNSYIQYHITSLKPIRPANKADNWETNALKSFESGTVKALELIDTDTAKVYRYMAPLMMNGACLKCHEQQGYKIGDIRGGISVTLPAGVYSLSEKSQERKILLIHLGLLTLGIAGLFMFKGVSDRYINIFKLKNVELEQQNEEITAQRDEIESQKAQLVEQKEAITESIEYASQIQSALLPPEGLLKYIFPRYFILFKPRDIVSGDFYWVSLKNNKIIFVVADCTGHGVPGALMSMLGGVLLNEVVNNIEVLQANEILNELKEKVIKSLHLSGKESETKTGMDIALCIFDTENKELQFSGAFNPLYLIRDSEVIETEADSISIGIDFEAGKTFTNHIIKIQKGDTIYLFSDGYADQFGGPMGKKFKYTQFKQLLLNIQDKIMPDQKKILEQTIEDWMNNTDKYGNSYMQVDDILVMGLRF